MVTWTTLMITEKEQLTAAPFLILNDFRLSRQCQLQRRYIISRFQAAEINSGWYVGRIPGILADAGIANTLVKNRNLTSLNIVDCNLDRLLFLQVEADQG